MSCFVSPISQAQPLLRPDHIVIVIEENRSFTQIIGNHEAPYINELAKRGALLTQSYGVTHPSQPNYLALFSGSTRGITSNACPLDLSGANLAILLQAKGLSFTSYAESMPQAGYDGCIYGAYMRKHNPAANWKELAANNQPFSAFPADYAQLPTVAFVVPDQRNDMHDGSIAQGDAWLKQNIERYAQWAMKHNSLLILTWDEDDGSSNNRIATIFLGAIVKPGQYKQRINHYNLLHTVEEMYGLAYLGESTNTQAVTDVWKTAIEVIQDFYIRYLSYDHDKTPNVKRPIIAMSKSFYEAVNKNAQICAAHISAPCGWGADGDEYLDTQEIDPNLSYLSSSIRFKSIKPNLVQVRLNVYPSVKDANGYYDKTITYKVVNENGSWVVDDVMYSDGVSTRQKMADENAYAIAHPDPDSPAVKQSIKTKR